MSMYDLTQNTLDSIEATVGKTTNATSEKKKGEENKDEYKLDLYDDHNDLPAAVTSTMHMRATDLCKMITSSLQNVLKELKGCTFRPGGNGLLEFVLVFQRNNQVQKDERNLVSIIGDTNNKMVSYVTTMQGNHNGRRTLTLSDYTKGILDQFMVHPIVNNGGRQGLGRIEWNKYIEEIEYATNQLYGRGNFETFVIVKGVNVEAILNNMFTPSQQKATDEENAKQRNTLVKPRYQYKIIFRGYRSFDAYNNIVFTQQRMMVNNYGNIQYASQFTLQDYFINIEKFDTDAIENIIPKAITLQNGPEYY